MKKRRRHLTLIEIMIVIALIGLIGGVLAYNLRGSLEEGKVFKTEQGGCQLYNVLMLEVAKGTPIETVPNQWQELVAQSPLTSKPAELCRDGWGQSYQIALLDDDLRISSPQYERHLSDHHKANPYPEGFR